MLKEYPVDVNRDGLLTRKEVAALFKISDKTAQRRQKEGNWPKSIVVNGGEYWPTSFINEYILEENPYLIESMANANQIQAAALAAVKADSK
ncbi:helix-turn-helix transcriptional regulator [Pseudomonas sp. HK3]